MSTRRNNGSHYENHQRAAELQDTPEHAHRAAGQSHSDHLTGTERSRQEHEHARLEHEAGSEMLTFGHEDIANLAYHLWEARGDAAGSPDEDWFRAVRELRQQSIAARSR